MSLERWRLERHELAIDRGLFWWGAFGGGLNAVYAVVSVVGADWGYVAAYLVCIVVSLAIAISAAADVAYKRGDVVRPYQLWVKRLRRWTHVALMGWS